MKQTLFSAITLVAMMLCGGLGYAGAKAKTPAADIEAGSTAQPQAQVAESQTEKAGQAPHATGKERAAEVGKGKKKGLEKQGYTIGGGEAKPGKTEKASKDEEEETEPAIVIGETSSDKETKPKTEPKATPKPAPEKTEEPAEQPQEKRGGGFGR